MSARIQWDGLDAVAAMLTHAPEEIRAEATEIVRDETTGAATECSQTLAHKTGTLARRVKATFPSETVIVGIVQSTAPHAHLYEFGTKRRENSHRANRGTMPAADRFVKIAQTRRERMGRRLKELLVRRGFAVDDV